MKKKTKQKKDSNRLVKVWAGIGIGFLALSIIGAATAGIAKAAVDHQKSQIYTAYFDLTSGSPKGVRKDAAKGMAAGINGEKNDFDKAYPWKSMHKITDSNGDVFVRIPKFYEKIDFVEDESLSISVSSAEHKGFHVAPAFVQGEEEVDYIDIASYEASIDKEGRLRSVSGVDPEVTGHTLDQYRSLAAKDGNQLLDYRGNQALQALFTVEFANLDSQSIMSGETQYAALCYELTADDIEAKSIKKFDATVDETMFISEDTDMAKFLKVNNDTSHVEIGMDHVDDEDEEKSFSVKKTGTKIAGFKINKEDESEIQVTLSEELDVSKMAEGETVYIAFGAYSCHKTGSSDNRKGSSNGASLKSLEVTSMNYRGIENWYGNTYTWCDGLATYQSGGVDYICVSLDASKNKDRDSYKQYVKTDVEGMMEDGIFMTEFNMVDENDSDTASLFDYFYLTFFSGEYRIGRVGGGDGDNASAGAFCLSVGGAVSSAYYSVRLSCLPH